MYKLFTTKNCHSCKILKNKLNEQGVPFEEVDIETVDGLTDYYFYNNKNRLSVPMLIEVSKREEYVDDITDKFL